MTHWSLVGRAGIVGPEQGRQAIARILTLYAPVLRGHLLMRWHIKPHEADDVVQDFLLSKVLLANILQLAEQSRGKFRTFLASALDNFVRNRLRDENRLKRGGNRNISLENAPVLPDQDGSPPDCFDYDWARQVLGQSVRRMHAHCAKIDRADIWGVFRGRILAPNLLGRELVPYTTLVHDFNLHSPRRASNVLMTGIRMFDGMVRGVIGLYAKDEDEIEGEIRDLWKAVSRPNSAPRRRQLHGE